LSLLKHDCVIRIYEIFQTEEYFFMVTEYMDQGDLLMKIKERGKFSEKEFIPIFK
jgi:serine/threonine protein kinase